MEERKETEENGTLHAFHFYNTSRDRKQKNIMKRRKAVLQAADLVTLFSYGFEFVVI